MVGGAGGLNPQQSPNQSEKHRRGEDSERWGPIEKKEREEWRH